MPLQVIIGTQWGDEGKGRIVDWYASGADFAARCNGGDNAGHTVTVDSRIHKLHLIPSGIIHPQVTAVLGSGMVVNPRTLLEEIDLLRQDGVEVDPRRLRLSHAAHLLTPAHQALDRALEARRGSASLGTTGRGIGPAYTDKAARRGLRLGDMLSAGFLPALRLHLEEANRTLSFLGASLLDVTPLLDEFAGLARQVSPYITDTSLELDAALRAGKKVIVEGAQGTLLDLDFGTYPYVTSSSTTAPGALTGLGLGLDAAREARVTGVVKAFQTRVGAGPFPTELDGDLALRLRGSGANPWDEYGTTTGRPRRVGWLDLVLLRYAVRLNGVRELAVTKLDILSGLDPILLCTGYRLEGQVHADLPLGLSGLAACTPIYEEFPVWEQELGSLRTWEALPPQARLYLERIAALAGVPVRLVSVGPERGQVIERPGT